MVGGSYSFYNLLPYLIDIFVKHPNSKGGHTCSGSLIAYDWVLTAAHCAKNKERLYYLGANLKENTAKPTYHGSIKFDFGQTRRVEKIFTHEEFNPKTLINDIALLKVRVPFKKDSQISLVQLPLKDENNDLSELFKYCYIGGWGRTGSNTMIIYNDKNKNWTYHEDYQSSSKMSYLVLPLISNMQCRRIRLDEVGLYFNVPNTQICTLYYPGRKSVCRGDSGSPLICGTRQYGIASWSYSCGAPRIGADVYTRVDKYVEWINKTINIYKNRTKIGRRSSVIELSYDYYDAIDSATSNMKIFFAIIFNSIIVIIIIK